MLASNQLAKKYGVKTGMALWQAKQACPGLIAVPPDFALYKHFSHMLRDIYEEYSDRVESFGLRGVQPPFITRYRRYHL